MRRLEQRVRPRMEGEHDMDVVLCFDVKAQSQAAVDFFVRMVRAQSQLIIRPKPKSILEKHEGEEEDGSKHEHKLTESAHEHLCCYLVGAPRDALVAIKEKKEKAIHGEVPPNLSNHVFNSGERIDLIMYELGRLSVDASQYHNEGPQDSEPVRRGDSSSSSSSSESSADGSGSESPKHEREGESTEAASTETSTLPAPFEDEEHGLLLQQALHSRFVSECFPLHDDKERHELVETWVKQWSRAQPLDNVRAYFGDEIGFYFGFLGMYTQWLVVPATLGLLVYVVEFLSDYGAYARGVYSLFVTSWATAFLKFWKRRESSLQNEWGISRADTLALEPPRADFWGERRFDTVEGCYYTYYPSFERGKRYGVTTLVTLAVLGVLVQFMFVYFWIEEWFVHEFTPAKGWDGYYEYVTLLPSIGYSVVVLLLDSKYSELATHLTQFENHRTDSEVWFDPLHAATFAVEMSDVVVGVCLSSVCERTSSQARLVLLCQQLWLAVLPRVPLAGHGAARADAELAADHAPAAGELAGTVDPVFVGEVVAEGRGGEARQGDAQQEGHCRQD